MEPPWWEREILRNKCNELLAAGPSGSLFSGLVILVKKQDGSDRMCVDYRELDSNAIPDRCPLPLIFHRVQRLAGAKLYSCLDMARGFYRAR